MTDRETREANRRTRTNERLIRLQQSQERQRSADIRTYGDGSGLLSGQQSSSGGDTRGGIWDVSTDNYQQPDRNQDSQNKSVNDGNGIDTIGAGGFPASESVGGGSLAGVEIIWADQTETFITAADILDDYDGEDYWSVVFAVSSGAFTKATPTYDATQELWDDVGTDQTKYRLRVKTLNTVPDPSVPTQLSAYGQYREEILCVNGDPVVNLIKIS